MEYSGGEFSSCTTLRFLLPPLPRHGLLFFSVICLTRIHTCLGSTTSSRECLASFFRQEKCIMLATHAPSVEPSTRAMMSLSARLIFAKFSCDRYYNRHNMFLFCFVHPPVDGKKTKSADDRKRYTATIWRHCAVQQNTPRFFTPIRDAGWSTQPRTVF